jgi:hypothetical protein
MERNGSTRPARCEYNAGDQEWLAELDKIFRICADAEEETVLSEARKNEEYIPSSNNKEETDSVQRGWAYFDIQYITSVQYCCSHSKIQHTALYCMVWVFTT